MTEWTELKNRVLVDALKRIDSLGVQYKFLATMSQHVTSYAMASTS